MFRAAVLSIVLTLAVGQNASLLCGTWCDPQAVAASGCHDEDPVIPPSVAGDGSCDHVVLSLAAFLGEDVRRGVSAPDTDHAIAAPRYQLAHSTPAARPGNDTAHRWPIGKRLLSTALRI